MSEHLQRLLARVAPTAPAFALGVLPVNLPTSPIVENDQRIGMPEFADLALPSDAAGPGTTAPAATVVADQPQTEATPAKVAKPRQIRPQTGVLTVSPAPAEAAPLAVQPVPRAANTRAGPREPDAFGTDMSANAPQPALPSQLLSPFAIPADDFEPAVRSAEAVPATIAASIAAHPVPAGQQAQPDPSPAAPAVVEPLPRPPAPLSPAMMAFETAPLPPAIAEPARAAPGQEPAVLAPDYLAEADAPGEQPRSVVIEELVIDITPPPTPAPQPIGAAGRAQPGTLPGPLSAEAVSVIGPLPHSRPYAALFGMRRR